MIDIFYKDLIKKDPDKWDGKPFFGVFWDIDDFNLVNNNPITDKIIHQFKYRLRKIIAFDKYSNMWISDTYIGWTYAADINENNHIFKIIKLIENEQRLKNMEKDFI